ncbi:MAG: hypothetical protein KatS3mg090_0549 [Patescibacteria group bacterium]|nr:MAG: hypothetical protein KatS3mg090_0549 [Patescibacteria group bacterium]
MDDLRYHFQQKWIYYLLNNGLITDDDFVQFFETTQEGLNGLNGGILNIAFYFAERFIASFLYPYIPMS